jgi:hypothetical protein
LKRTVQLYLPSWRCIQDTLGRDPNQG